MRTRPATPDGSDQALPERPCGSRPLIPGLGIFLIAVFSVLYLVDPALYTRILVWVTRDPFVHPFIDWEWIPSAVRCWQLGVNVYIDNTCYEPFAHGRHGYSPLWLRMTFLPYGKVWLATFGLSFAVLFFATLATLPRPRGAVAFWATLLATISPLTAFAIERANVDLIMFLFIIGGVHCWLGKLSTRLAAYGLFMVAGLLKFYPFVLLALALRERPRVFTAVCAATVAILLSFGLAFHDELVLAGANIPNGPLTGDMFAASNLPYGIAMMSLPSVNDHGEPSAVWSHSQSLAGHIGLALMTLIAIGCAAGMERRFRIAGALAAMPRGEAGFLIAGAVLVCGCFFVGQNVGYRAIMILPALPGLFCLGRSLSARAGRLLFTAAGCAVVPIMWVLPIQQIIATVFAPFGCVALVHWLLNQLAWWWVTTMLLTVVLGFLLSSEMGRMAAARATGRGNRIALDITPVLSRTPGRDATQETGHEIRHLL